MICPRRALHSPNFIPVVNKLLFKVKNKKGNSSCGSFLFCLSFIAKSKLLAKNADNIYRKSSRRCESQDEGVYGL